MSRRLAALGAVVCFLTGNMPAAIAQPVPGAPDSSDPTVAAPTATPTPTPTPTIPVRRPVAVIDLVGESQSESLRLGLALNEILVNHPHLSQVRNTILSSELLGTLQDPDGQRMQAAWQAKTSAENALASFQFAAAANHVEGAHKELLLVTPTAAAVQTYAELAFLLGQARLGERNAAAAATAFTIAHRLAPTFAPDPAKYLPEVIAAYDAAKKTVSVVRLSVIGQGRVWLDGKETGVASANAPLELDVQIGPHVVWMTGPERETRGKVINVLAASDQKTVIDDAPATDRVLVQRARARLKFAPDPTSRAAAMKHLAGLLSVGDAVLLSMTKSRVIVQTWRDRAPGFSALREKKSNEQPAELLKPLEPVPVKVVKPDPPPTKLPPMPVPFYKQRKWQVVMVTGVLGAIAGSVWLYRNRDTGTGIDPMPSFGDNPPEARR